MISVLALGQPLISDEKISALYMVDYCLPFASLWIASVFEETPELVSIALFHLSAFAVPDCDMDEWFSL